MSPIHAWTQADYAREKRWADEIVPAMVVGDALRLELKSGRKVLAIYTPAPKTMAGVVVVHGLGVNPDWGLIGTLRSRLPDYGYATLSVQMPVLVAGALGEDYPALFPEAAERLAAAVAHLNGKGFEKVAIVFHSMGARMSNYFLTHVPGARVAAWVAIGLPTFVMEPASVRIPVLDLHGERDVRPCSATRRRAPSCCAPSAVRRRSKSPGPTITSPAARTSSRGRSSSFSTDVCGRRGSCRCVPTSRFSSIRTSRAARACAGRPCASR